MYEALNLGGQRVVPNLSYEQFKKNKPLYIFPLTASDHISNETLPLIKDGCYTIKVLTLIIVINIFIFLIGPI